MKKKEDQDKKEEEEKKKEVEHSVETKDEPHVSLCRGLFCGGTCLQKSDECRAALVQPLCSKPSL